MIRVAVALLFVSKVALAQPAMRVHATGCSESALEAVEQLASIEMRQRVQVAEADAAPVHLHCTADAWRVIVGDDVRELSAHLEPEVLSRMVALVIVESLRAVELRADADTVPREDESDAVSNSAPNPSDGDDRESDSSPARDEARSESAAISVALAGGVRSFFGAGILGGTSLSLQVRAGHFLVGIAALFHRGSRSVELGTLARTLLGGVIGVGVASTFGSVDVLGELGLGVDETRLRGEPNDPARVQGASGRALLVTTQFSGALRWRVGRGVFLLFQAGAEIVLVPVRPEIDGSTDAELRGMGLFGRVGLGWST